MYIYIHIEISEFAPCGEGQFSRCPYPSPFLPGTSDLSILPSSYNDLSSLLVSSPNYSSVFINRVDNFWQLLSIYLSNRNWPLTSLSLEMVTFRRQALSISVRTPSWVSWKIYCSSTFSQGGKPIHRVATYILGWSVRHDHVEKYFQTSEKRWKFCCSRDHNLQTGVQKHDAKCCERPMDRIYGSL